MGKRAALIPYHFGLRWDIIPEREGPWTVIEDPARIQDRLQLLAKERAELVVSGDCMAAIGAHRDGLPIVWLDAHGDFNTLSTTETGNLGGMPLAMLAGLGGQSLMLACELPRRVSEIYHLGGSEFDPGEMARMLKEGVRVFHDGGDRCGFRRPVHLHIDTDVICSDDLPSSIHPAKHGWPLEYFWQVVDGLIPNAQVLSIKTYDPRLDLGGVGQGIVLELIRRFCTHG